VDSAVPAAERDPAAVLAGSAAQVAEHDLAAPLVGPAAQVAEHDLAAPLVGPAAQVAEHDLAAAEGPAPAALPVEAGGRMAKLRITWVKSSIGYAKDQKVTVKTLGLRRLHHTVEQDDNPAIRGMVHKVRHLVRVERIEDVETEEAMASSSSQAATPLVVVPVGSAFSSFDPLPGSLTAASVPEGSPATR
jgi:large subunit ribosomal protein L30